MTTMKKHLRRSSDVYTQHLVHLLHTPSSPTQPFLRWVRGKGLKVGIISNSEYRYPDVILPALGLNQVKELYIIEFNNHVH